MHGDFKYAAPMPIGSGTIHIEGGTATDPLGDPLHYFGQDTISGITQRRDIFFAADHSTFTAHVHCYSTTIDYGTAHFPTTPYPGVLKIITIGATTFDGYATECIIEFTFFG